MLEGLPSLGGPTWTVEGVSPEGATPSLPPPAPNDVSAAAGWGDPAEVIIETAQRLRADTIVMGRRGRGRLAGPVLGSVSQKVASFAPSVVILVP
jgi:hypothetical protein